MAEDRHNPLNNPTVADRFAARPPAAPDEADPSIDEFLNDIWGTTTPETPEPAETTAEAVGEPAPSSPGEAPGSEPAPGQAPASPPATPGQPDAAALPVQPRFAYAGDFYTIEELAQRGYLAEALQKATQYDQQQQQPPAQQQPQAQPPAQPQPQLTPTEVAQRYAPVVQQMVQQGWMDEDVPTLYPMAATGMAQLHMQMQGLLQAVNVLATDYQQRQQHTVAETATKQFDTLFNAIQQEDEIYKALADQKTREDFRNYIVDKVNPEMNRVDPDFVKRQWFAYNYKLMEDLQHQVRSGQGAGHAPPAPPPAAPVTPPRGAARLTRTAEPEPEPWADMLEGLLPRR